MDMVNILIPIIQLIFEIGIFAAIVGIGRYLINYVNSSDSFKDSKFFKMNEYFPQEKIVYLKQVFYLIMVLVFIIIDLYLIFDWGNSSYYFFIIDILISTYLALTVKGNSPKDYLILFLLIPFGSLARVVLGDTILELHDIFHIIGYVYFMKVYYSKFVKYTENNGLGVTIILLFSIILVSFLFTMIVENVSPLDSIAMVSNAFTSNSFDPAGKTTIGKLDSLLLAWGGFILSGVGTATLSVALIKQYVNREFDQLEELIKNKKKEK